MMSLDRPAMAAAVLGPYGLPADPVDNRLFVPGVAGYGNDGAGYDQPAPTAALQLLEANGYTRSGGLLRAADGSPLSLSLAVEPDDLEAQQLAAQVVGDCAALGITVSLTNTGPNGTPLPGWQMAIEVRPIPVARSSIAGRYSTGGADNLDGYSSTSMSSLLAEIHTVPAAQLSSLYGLVDVQAWADFVDIPLVWVPEIVAAKARLLNVLPVGRCTPRTSPRVRQTGASRCPDPGGTPTSATQRLVHYGRPMAGGLPFGPRPPGA